METKVAEGTTLKTEPLEGTDPTQESGEQPPAAAPRKPVSKAVPIGKSATFAEGDHVLFHVKHLHGLHGVITADAGEGQFIIRGAEEAIEGQLFQFAAEDLVAATVVHLASDPGSRLEWDYAD